MKAHYSGQRLLFQILFFETACFWASTKFILNYFFVNGTWNKVVQNPKNKILKKNPTLKLILKLIKLDEVLNHILHMNSLSHVNSIWRIPFMWFHKKTILMRFFIQTNINMWIHESSLKSHYHLKGNKNCVGRFVLKIHFMCLSKCKMKWKKNCPPKLYKIYPPKNTFSCLKCTTIVWFQFEFIKCFV